MKISRIRPSRALAGVCAVLVLLVGITAGAYAADLGGFRQTFQIWLHGELTQVIVEQVGEKEFNLIYPEDAANGIAPASEDGSAGIQDMTIVEMQETLFNQPEVYQEKDGSIWFYYRNHKIDLTEQIRENGYAQFVIRDGILPDYYTVNWYDGAYSISVRHFGYAEPEALNERG